MNSTLNKNKFTKKEANEIVGGLSAPGKMPGKSWSIPASECKRGKSLAKISGTICSNCYALKNRYNFSNVQKALKNRFDSMNHPDWIDAMVTLINNDEYFRWFDSGDLQSIDQLKRISAVCNKTKKTKHWLPTREYSIVKDFLKEGNKIPDNLNIRISADFIGEDIPKHIVGGCTVSTSDNVEKKDTNNCPASFKRKEGIKSCDDANCYACWDKNVFSINYKNH